MATTIYHGGKRPEAKRPGRLWVTEDIAYAREYAEAKGGKVYATCLDLSRLSVLDLTEAGLDAERAAELLRAAGVASAVGYSDEEPHCVVRRISDEACRAAGIDAIRIMEDTDGRRAESLCLVRS